MPALDCNCSICRMTGFLHIMVLHEAFELVSGREALSAYRFGTGAAEHLFCRTCGVKSFARVGMPGGQFIAIMVSCLDNVADTDLAQLPIVFIDGRNDDFQSSPAETRHL